MIYKYHLFCQPALTGTADVLYYRTNYNCQLACIMLTISHTSSRTELQSSTLVLCSFNIVCPRLYIPTVNDRLWQPSIPRFSFATDFTINHLRLRTTCNPCTYTRRLLFYLRLLHCCLPTIRPTIRRPTFDRPVLWPSSFTYARTYNIRICHSASLRSVPSAARTVHQWTSPVRVSSPLFFKRALTALSLLLRALPHVWSYPMILHDQGVLICVPTCPFTTGILWSSLGTWVSHKTDPFLCFSFATRSSRLYFALLVCALFSFVHFFIHSSSSSNLILQFQLLFSML